MSTILLSAKYLDLIVQATHFENISDVIALEEFPRYLRDLKFKLKGEGRIELYNAIVSEEIHMLEKKNSFL